MIEMSRGLLIAFEGGEACGKTTQASLLAKRLDAVLTREPGGSEIGEHIRRLLLDPASFALVPRAEALLMAADRAQHFEEVILPALRSGTHVVTDRFIGSSLAYQGFGRGLDLEEVRELSRFACGGFDADLVVLLDVPADQAMKRLGHPTDRLEAAGESFHRRVLNGFKVLGETEGDNWIVVDGTGSPDEVEAHVWSALEPRITQHLSVSTGGDQP